MYTGKMRRDNATLRKYKKKNVHIRDYIITLLTAEHMNFLTIYTYTHIQYTLIVHAPLPRL